MVHMSRFSIIVPVYNVENYLEECVKSVLEQTFSDFELILVDDGSKDKSGSLCDRLAAEDDRIRVIHQENQGLSGARNTGINAANGDYLMFLDSDDWWASADCLQKIADRLELNQADVLSYNYQKSTDGVLSAPYFQCGQVQTDGTLGAMTTQGLWVTGACNKAISRLLLAGEQLRFRRGITSEDIDWTMRLAIAAQRFDFVDVCVFVYRQRSGSITHSVSAKAVKCLKDNVLECVRLLQDASEEKAAALRPVLAYQYATLLFNFAGLSKTERKEMDEDIRSLLPWLQYSNDTKVRLIRTAMKLAGFRGAIALLSIKQRLGK